MKTSKNFLVRACGQIARTCSSSTATQSCVRVDKNEKCSDYLCEYLLEDSLECTLRKSNQSNSSGISKSCPPTDSTYDEKISKEAEAC